ncbi:hypothetical protein DCC39_11615 [Pueribacillus theae]|uniref:Multi-TM2 domain-containing protein n=1 Tax=Pueribacillus theae TaxID=2171751 RepID=A0A2U1JZH6_9BACI|nr:hypothetical protein [Pueribacillus theae]PWA10354.1 hypothetical protein DCC39_11615 [Pueribacillus theae]
MKTPIIAFLLAFFPGGGLLYLGKIRGLFYTLAVFGIPFLSFIMYQWTAIEPFIVFALGGLLMYIINFVDTVVTASKLIRTNEGASHTTSANPNFESERFFTIILSMIPGLGHFQLGLMNRGLTLLVSFFGLGAMVVFVTGLAGRGEFLIFLALLPVIWVYSFFDGMQLLNKKQKGEELVDRSLLEDFETRREDGKKSKAIATLLSIFPGAGHLYLGLQRRGVQLMAAFLFSIYILDVLHLGIFLFLVPIIWFYSFFDGLQKASKLGIEPLEDTPVISYFINNQKWVGIGLVLLGCYYLITNILLPVFSPIIQEYFNVDFAYWFSRYFQITVVCILLIGGGIKLLSGSREKTRDKEASE